MGGAHPPIYYTMAKKKRKQLTPLQKEYKKEMNRIARWAKSVAKRGYTLKRGRSIDLVLPARVTQKALRDIRNLTPEVLYYSYEKLDTTTGELIPGHVARKQERRKAAAKATNRKKEKKAISRIYGPDVKVLISPQGDHGELMADYVIKTYKEELLDLHPKGAYVLTKWVNDMIAKHGKLKTADIIGEAKDSGILIEPGESYKNEVLARYIAQMEDLMQRVGTDPATIRELSDAMDAEEEIDDIEDY